MTQKTKQKLHRLFFESHTPEGRKFSLCLISFIMFTVMLVMLDSVAEIRQEWGFWIENAELLITIVFTVEYILRIYCLKRPVSYIFSFYGIVDLLAILPGYASLISPDLLFLTTIRILRLLRIFRALKLVQFIGGGNQLLLALKRSSYKITVFITTILTIVIIAGSLMYMIEGAKSGFTSIPKSVYWAIVTVTTVGYGDISPVTTFGQFVASLLMITGYGIIAVPTGIITSEMMRPQQNLQTKVHQSSEQGNCPCCGKPFVTEDAGVE
jgi:voltage-gated potassium channel